MIERKYQPPFHNESEQAVLGALLLTNGDAIDRVADILSAGDFYREDHQRIYTAITRLAAEGKPADVITVAEAMDRHGRDGALLAYLGEIAANTPSAGNVRRYANTVVERRMSRQLLNVADRLSQLAIEPGEIEDRMSEAQSLVMALAEKNATREPRRFREIALDLVEWMQERNDSDDELTGLPTGFCDLDEATSGLQEGDLIIVAGRPGMGKTTLAMNISEDVSVRPGFSTLVFSLEMSERQLAQRTVSSLGSLELSKVRNPKRMCDGDNDWSKLSAALGKLTDANFFVDEAAGITVAQMHAKARRIKRKYGLNLIVIDYIQLMSGSDRTKGRGRVEEISEITRGLKLMAKDLHVPVIALSQLSRQTEGRADKRPQMSDLRESGSIEQDADVIILMYRDEYYNPDTAYPGVAEANIAKQRMGPTKTIGLQFEGHLSRFRSYSGVLPSAENPTRNRSSDSSFRRGG